LIGNRVSGSENLEHAVQYMVQALQMDGLDNVHAEAVTIPHWERGYEYANMITPRAYPMQILGLGSSVGTQMYGSDGITAQVVVFQSFDELANNSALAKGKIVVWNQQCDWVLMPVDCYGISVVYRVSGASAAAAAGAVASLTRTVAPFSIYSPHTGMQVYSSNVTQIPAACITIEDAEMMQRMQDRGQTITLKLYMEAKNLPNATGHNVVAEITGSTYPEEVVLVSGHLDSWDVGQGAMDDGGGAFISWQALTLVRQLGFKPLRTLRLVLWSCEEFGGVGAQQYFTKHQSEVADMDLVMESDLGVFTPQGIQFAGNAAAMQVMQGIGTLLTSINASAVTTGGEGTDINYWMVAGVPGASLLNENQQYFWFHHSHGDTMTVMDPTAMDLASATWAVTAYTVANLPSMLPR